MGWDKGKYYTRSKKVGGRVVREYYGTGPIGQIVANLDRDERNLKSIERAMRRLDREDDLALENQLDELGELTDLMARATLLAAGFHQHKRGEWRKKREHNDRKP